MDYGYVLVDWTLCGGALNLTRRLSLVAGSEPATSMQLGFIASLAKQHKIQVPAERLKGLSKSEASSLVSQMGSTSRLRTGIESGNSDVADRYVGRMA